MISEIDLRAAVAAVHVRAARAARGLACPHLPSVPAAGAGWEDADPTVRDLADALTGPPCGCLPETTRAYAREVTTVWCGLFDTFTAWERGEPGAGLEVLAVCDEVDRRLDLADRHAATTVTAVG
jgi:hypothetical protein